MRFSLIFPVNMRYRRKLVTVIFTFVSYLCFQVTRLLCIRNLFFYLCILRSLFDISIGVLEVRSQACMPQLTTRLRQCAHVSHRWFNDRTLIHKIVSFLSATDYHSLQGYQSERIRYKLCLHQPMIGLRKTNHRPLN